MPAREAARLPAALPAGPQYRLFWIIVLCADLLLLLLLPQMVWVGAALLGLLALAAFAARAEWTLALLFLGGPLFQPLGLAGSDALALQIGLRGLFVVAWLLALGRDRGAGRAGEVLASSGALARPVSGGAAFASALRDPQTLILVALTLLLWAGLARTPAPTYGDEKLKSWLVTNCTLFLAPLLLWPLWGRRRHLDGFLRGAVALGALFAGVGVLALLGLVGSGLEGPPLGRLAWLGTSPIWVGRLLAIWIVLLCWSASRRLLAWPIACALALLALWLLLRTGSRGPLLALFACPAALLLLPARCGGPRPGAIVLRITLALGLAGALLLLVLPEPVRERTAAVLLRGPAGLLSGAGSEAWLRDPA
ncbi:MAG: hypothetical protein FJY75_08735, partial [Candidatus Eisenbacteria bacterium]|nr:hypothetical protein [Candidatus Eisenbacteria bacterium]